MDKCESDFTRAAFLFSFLFPLLRAFQRTSRAAGTCRSFIIFSVQNRSRPCKVGHAHWNCSGPTCSVILAELWAAAGRTTTLSWSMGVRGACVAMPCAERFSHLNFCQGEIQPGEVADPACSIAFNWVVGTDLTKAWTVASVSSLLLVLGENA